MQEERQKGLMPVYSRASLDARVRLAPNVLCQELEGEAVMLNLDRGFYYSLDEVGAAMLRLMDSGTLESVAAGIEREYDVEPERCRADVLRLAGQMLEHGILEIAS